MPTPGVLPPQTYGVPWAVSAVVTALAAFSFGASTTLPSGRVIFTPSEVTFELELFCPLGVLVEAGVLEVSVDVAACCNGALASEVASEPAWPAMLTRVDRFEPTPLVSAPGRLAGAGLDGGGGSWVIAAVWVSSSPRTRPTTPMPWLRCAMAEPTRTGKPCGAAIGGPGAGAG